MIDRGGAKADSWMALRPGDDADARAIRLAELHRAVVGAGRDTEGTTRLHEEPNAVRPLVRESWLRSLRRSLDPDVIDQPALLGGTDFDNYRAQHATALIRPVVRKLLVEDAADSGLLIAISDERGRLLWIEGDHAARDRALTMSFAEGADWSEEHVGTNAPGTALALDRCVQIFGAEHYNRAVHEWSCSAATVHDPIDGRILGAVDITGGPRVAAPEVLQLVRATVAAAEAELRLIRLESPPSEPSAVTVLEAFGPGRAVLVRGRDRVTLSQRHAEILLLLSEHPEGLGTHRLAALLDENELDSVTVRVEISRLRKVLGPDILASRPYRLRAELRTDVAEVRAALDRGDLDSAVRRYTGRVLPRSYAPGVIDVGDELDTRIRGALLRRGSAPLLARWTASVHGRGDLAAWTAYLGCLDPESSLFAQVEAKIRVLDRNLAT
ncbi:helix-turn-helix domain-containing protein [Rhodococcus coprophilus]|uniref:Transcriptional regulator n=1 Tax=Rhodococcus coprophilus TaxID=38310 RepID=A0A2X4USN7_9NOCA|nr:helix-turn-helix domain-containing protein [Rhodococcus coprophilus]MBM7459897.1 transcriptional regulator of acetoin/glycerol metabolism [Rhodococcus coprophilus]SQI37652.1 transcriptional regulator [Rhodococcus coprophilus]